MQKPRIVFFGSGPVAAASLELLAADFEIEAVVTKPKPVHHRASFPVLDVVEKLQLQVHTVSTKTELSAVMATRPFLSTTGVLIDFGIIIARDAIDYFPKGIVNSHFSLLPQWRGADPITFSLLSGQSQTGVSLMLLVEKMDEGPLLCQGVYEIQPADTTPSLTDELIKLSYALLRDSLPSYISGEPHPETGMAVKPASQAEVARMMNLPSEPTYSRKLTKEDGRIVWSKSAEQLEREVRAYLEWPKSYTRLGTTDVIITQAYVVPSQPAGAKPGDIEVIKDINALAVCTGNGTLYIQKLKPAGKKEMSAEAFLAGYGKTLEAA